MKNILILLLCISLILSSALVAPVLGAQAQEGEMKESGDLSFMKALGLMESDVNDQSPVTRIELAEIYTKIALGDAVTEKSGIEIPFSDCKIDEFAAGFVNSCGIMCGVGDGKFAPDNIITFNQLIKTAVTFLGYEDEAKAYGGYPSGYLIMATRLGIIKGETSLGDVEITTQKVASVFKLMQNAPVRRRVVFGGSEQWLNENINYLTLYMGIERIRDVITATHSTDIYEGDSFDYYDVVVADNRYEAADSMKGIINYLGYRVDIYVENNATIGKILYYEVAENNVFEISGRNIAAVDGQKISYYNDEGDTRTVNYSKNVFVIYNGTVAYSYSPSTINPFATSALDGGIKLIDNNGDKIYDYILVDAFDTFVVSKNMGGMIFNKYRPYEIIDLNGLENKDIEFINIKGEPIDLTYAAEGDILSVSKDLNGVPKKIVLTVDKYSGTVKEISYAKGNIPESINISGNTFLCAESIAHSTELQYLKVGERITMFFNKNGEVAEISASDDITYAHGYVTDAAINKGIEEKFELKIFTTNGTFIVSPLAPKIKTNDDILMTDKEFYNSLSKDSNGRIDRLMIAYNLNDKEEIDEIILPDLTGATGPFYRYKDYDGSFTVPGFKALSFENKLMLDSQSTKIMVVPIDEERDDDEGYYIASTSGFFGDWAGYDGRPNPQFEAFGSKPGNPTAETLLVKGDVGKNLYDYSRTYTIVVDKITQITNENGNMVYKLYGFSNGSVKTFETDDSPAVLNAVKKILNDGDPKGDVILLEYDAKNVIFSLEWLYNNSSNNYAMVSNPNNTAWNYRARIICGRVIYADNYAFTVEAETAPGIYIRESFPTAKFAITECNYRSNRQGTVARKDKSVVFDSEKYPGNESYVIVFTSTAQPKELIVINK